MKLALIGAGKIVQMVLDALTQLPEITPVAVYVRPGSVARGQSLQQQYGITQIYTDYAALLQEPTIDAVYLGIPNHLHFTFAEQALRAGKHVICEKPFTSNLAEAAALVQLARAQQCYLFDAVTVVHMPAYHWLQQQLPAIGPVRLVQANYSQYSSRYDDYLLGKVHPAFDPAMSGGALYDINLYNIYAVCGLFGAPHKVEYRCNRGHNGIDVSGVLTLHYADFIAVCCGAKDSESPGHVTVQGTQGFVRIAGTPNMSQAAELGLRQMPVERFSAADANHMVHEFAAFLACWQQQDQARCDGWLDLALIVAGVLEAARRDAGIRFPCDEASHP